MWNRQSLERTAIIIRRKANDGLQSDLTPAAPRYLLRLNHHILKYSRHHDSILTSSFASRFRFIHTSLVCGIAPASSRGEKNRVPLGQPALGGQATCRVGRSW